MADWMEMSGEYTVKDIELLPEGERAELIDGMIYDMAPPNRKHQELVHQLSWEIETYIRSHGGGCKVYPAPFAVYLTEDGRNYVEPDISVICDRGKLTDKGCEGAPDWVIEIVSPGSRYMDYLRKLLKYEKAGVREYWIVDYGKDRVTVYNFKESAMMEYSFKDSVKAGIFQDFSIDFSSIELYP